MKKTTIKTILDILDMPVFWVAPETAFWRH